MSRKHLAAMIVGAVLMAVGATIAQAHHTTLDNNPGVLRRQSSPTAVPLQFPTATPTAGPPTETPTRTPTLGSRPLVEAFSESNIRAGPDISESLIGQIFAGTQYQVLGKIGNWYQIEYPNSPSGTAWVYFEVVKVIGDPALIPDLNPADVATVDPAFLAEQETAQAIANTPGAAATLTAQVQITPTGAGETGATLVPGAPLPTFTYPAYTPTPVAFPRTNPPPPEASGMPPLVPILALGALGLMGLLVALMRRL